MVLPSVYNNLCVFFNYGFYYSNLLFLESVIIYLFYRLDIVFCFTIIFDNMHMNRFVVVGIEHKPETKEYKYCWHGVSPVICYVFHSKGKTIILINKIFKLNLFF